jgi:two-component system phosphate regulon response regulator OmpR
MGIFIMSYLTYSNDMTHTILIIDDDTGIQDLISRFLDQHGYVTISALNGDMADDFLRLAHIDLILCDVMMPRRNGFEWLDDFRKINKTIPVIMLTAMGDVENRIKGLSSGADDYIPKPFDPRELLLRMELILKRIPAPQQNQIYYSEPLYIDLLKQSLSLSQDMQNPCALSESETQILKTLIDQSGQAVTREQLCYALGDHISIRAVDVAITRLRRKMNDYFQADLTIIHTLRGQGYKIYAEQIE